MNVRKSETENPELFFNWDQLPQRVVVKRQRKRICKNMNNFGILNEDSEVVEKMQDSDYQNNETGYCDDWNVATKEISQFLVWDESFHFDGNLDNELEGKILDCAMSESTKDFNLEVGVDFNSRHVSHCKFCLDLCSVETSIDVNQLLETQSKVHESGLPNYIGCKIPIFSRFNLQFLKFMLHGYHDSEVVDFLEYGWPISHDKSDTQKTKPKNHKGALDFSSELEEYLKKEKVSGSILGPFKSNPLKCPITMSPLNTVPKKDCEERRVILDLSFPRNMGSVNDGIDKDYYLGEKIKLSYPSVDSLVEIIKKFGRGCLLFKRDLRKFYRQIPLCPGDIHLLGYNWKNHIFLDRVLTMGLRSACFIAQRLTKIICFMMKKLGFELLNYIDDLVGCHISIIAFMAYECLKMLLGNSGFVENVSKRCPPSTRMVFLGVLFDTEKLTLEVTPERLAEILTLLGKWSGIRQASRKQIESLLGKLNFVASCVRSSRIFICRMLNFLRGLPRRGVFEIPLEFQKDVQWWIRFLPLYQGVSIMSLVDWSKPDKILACDACLMGIGGCSQTAYFHSQFPIFILAQSLHINALEMLGVMVSIKLWGHLWKGKKILIKCDNLSSVLVLNSGRTKDVFLQACMREIAFLASIGEFEIHGTHVLGTQNRIPDLLSRWDLDIRYQNAFLKMNDTLQLMEVEVPKELFLFSHDW